MSTLDNLSSAQLGAFVAHTRANGGASMSPRTGTILPEGHEAYMVGGHPDKSGNRIPSKIVPADEFGEEHVRDYAASARNVIDPVDRSARIGSWHNTDDGNVYLDVSSHMLDPHSAVKAGRERNEISVWDNKHMRELPTGGNGQNE
jgi:hypothetical protein